MFFAGLRYLFSKIFFSPYWHILYH